MKKIVLIIITGLFALTVSAQLRTSLRPRQTQTRPQTQEEKLNDQYCSGIFKSTDGTIIDLSTSNNISASGSSNILDWLEGRVAGLKIFTLRSNIRIPYIRGQQAGIYIDEIPISPGSLRSVAVTDIAIIKIIKTPFMGGINGPGGAIAIYTWKGDED